MTREQFIEGMDAAIEDIVEYTNPLVRGFPFSCCAIENRVSNKAKCFYEELFNPTTNGCRTIWFDKYDEENDDRELLPMRLTMMLLFKEQCLGCESYEEF